MKKNEVKNSVSNVVVIETADSKLLLEVGNVYEFDGKKLSITNKRSHTEEKPTIGKKTLWTGNVDGVEFTEVDSCKVRKLFGLAERKRESNGKVFIHEGYSYKLDESADIMIAYAMNVYDSITKEINTFKQRYNIDDFKDIDNVRKSVTAKVESVCLARKIHEEEEKKRKEAEKAEKAKASKEYKEKVKKAKVEFFALLAAGAPLSQVTDKIKKEFGLQLTDLA